MPIKIYDFLGKTSKFRPSYNKFQKITINLDEGLLSIVGSNKYYNLSGQIDLQGTGGDLYITWTMSQQNFESLWTEAYEMYKADQKLILDIKILDGLMETYKSINPKEFF